MKLRLPLILIGLLIPITTMAKQETVWDFRGSQLPGEWQLAGLDVPETTAEGLHLTASKEDGTVISALKLPHAIHSISLVFITGIGTEAQFGWHRSDMEPGLFTQLPFTIPASPVEQRIDLNFDTVREWDARVDQIGVTLPKGADLYLREIRFTRWSLMERVTSAWKSFWTFDKLGAISINFVWGPVMVFSPTAVGHVFDKMPPEGRSGMWVGYLLLIVAAVIAGTRELWKNTLPRLRVPGALILFFLLFAGIWAVFDVRMGLEMLGYARHDYETYLSPPPGERAFRTFLNFNDAVDRTMPYVKGAESLALLTTRETPIRDMLRYFVFPTEVIEAQGPDIDQRFWFVFHRSDAAVDAKGRLTVGGVPWTASGGILKQFDSTSFLFRTSQ